MKCDRLALAVLSLLWALCDAQVGHGRNRGGPPPPPGYTQKVASDPLQVARDWFKKSQAGMYSYHVKYIGPSDGYFAPIVQTREGNFLVVGTTNHKNARGKRDPQPIAALLDAEGKEIWKKKLSRKGFVDFEAASGAQTHDGGFIVYILSYRTPVRTIARFVRLDPKGKVLWHRQLRGKGRVDTPFPTVAKVTENNGVLLKGHIAFPKEEGEGLNYFNWEGELSSQGKVVKDEVGIPNPTGLLKKDRPW